MARVALVVPSGRGLGTPGPLLTRVLRPPPPGGVASLAASLRAAGHTLLVLDQARTGQPPGEVVRRIALFSPDAVGVSVLGADFEAARGLTQALRSRLPGVLLFWGNALPSTWPSWTLDAVGELDAIVVGEGEQAAVELLASGDGAGVPGVATRSTPNPPPRPPITELDSLPFPAWDLLGPRRYPASPQLLLGGAPTLGVVQSRGCPWDCSFCAQNFAWPGVAFRSAESVAEEIDRNRRDWGVTSFGFYDAIFPLERDFGEQLYAALGRRGLIGKVRFFCETRVDLVWPDTFAWLKRAGLHLVFLGIEAVDPELLTGAGKVRGAAATYRSTEAVETLRGLGLRTYGLFLLGLPGETEEQRRALERFLLQIPVDIASVGIATPYAGAPGVDSATPPPELLRAVNFGAAPGRDAELVRWQRRLMLRFYARPRVVLRQLVRGEIPLHRLGIGAAALVRAAARR